jgi:hypothetical protein
MTDEDNEVTHLAATGASSGLLDGGESNPSHHGTQSQDASGKNDRGKGNEMSHEPENAAPPEMDEERNDEVGFLKHLLTTHGSSQVLFVLLLMAMSQGSTVGVVRISPLAWCHCNAPLHFHYVAFSNCIVRCQQSYQIDTPGYITDIKVRLATALEHTT